MAISDDFAEILEVGGGDLKVQWPKLVRAVKSLTAFGVALDGGDLEYVKEGDGDVLLGLDADLNRQAQIAFESADSEFWRLGMGTGQEFRIDNGADNVLTLEPNAPDEAVYVDADGHVGFGANPTASNKVLIDNGTGAVDVRIRTGDATATSLLLENSVATWRMFTAVSGVFALQDASAGTQPITVQEGADNNALFIDDAGHIGLGLDPTATFDFIAALGDADIWRFQAGDATANFQINAGATTGHNADIALLGEFSTQWILRKNTADNFEIRSNAGAAFFMEQGADPDSIFVDADGNVGIGGDPTAAFGLAVTKGNIWYFHNQANASSSLRMGAGGTTEQIFDLIWVDAALTASANTIQWRMRKEISNRFVMFDALSSFPIVVEQSAVLGDTNNSLYIDSTGHVGIGFANPGTKFYVANADALGASVGSQTEIAVFEDTFASGSNENRFRINTIRRAGTINTWGGGGIRLEANIDDNGTAQCWIEMIHPDDTDLANHYISFGESTGTEWARFQNGGLIVGTAAAPAASAGIEINSTTLALRLPQMTTTQRNALTAVVGLMIYNTSTDQVEVVNNAAAWKAVP